MNRLDRASLRTTWSVVLGVTLLLLTTCLALTQASQSAQNGGTQQPQDTRIADNTQA